MQTWEAEPIAESLAHSWPRSSISIKAWADELADLDKARAEQAARQLIRSSEHAPSIAAFLSAYRQLAGTVTPDFMCPQCANSGWVTDTNHPAHWPGKQPAPAIPEGWHADDGCICNVVTPCRCTHGQLVRKQRQKHNKEL